ncbi:MAG: glycosyltransferase family 4 protein [bacterium]|nr:glycosyltransferase family 4 protein [bacterium]
MSPLSACTIVSKNYIPFARVLGRSFREHHPDGRFFVLLVDRNEGRIDPGQEPFTLLEVEDLENVPELRSFLFKYTLLEANTAVKPYLLEHLFECYDLPNLIYFDPDILITGSLDELADLVERHSIVLTPHLTEPIDDAAWPSELAFLQSGTYNLGFIGLKRSETTSRLLPWWQERLWDRCLVRIEQGLFVDQKWIDLVPGIFDDVHVHTHPGYNVAYWNLNGRTVTMTEDGPHSNGEPLIFFHFSGVEPESLEQVSKHQDRFTLAGVGEAAELFRRYTDLVIAAGYRECKPWPYAFGRFDNGAPIPEMARSLYHSLSPAKRRRFGDPFAAGSKDSFFTWLNQPRGVAPRKPPYLSRLLYHLYQTRSDLKRSFPDVERGDFPGFCSWLLEYGRHEFRLDDAYLKNLFHDSRATLFTAAGLKRRLVNRLKRFYHSDLGKKAKRTSKKLLGHERAQSLRQRLRPSQTVAESDGTGGPRLVVPEKLERLGVNLVGYLQAETGMGEAARSLARALATTDVPVSLHSIDLNVLARQDDASFAPAESEFPYDVNLFVVNADQVGPLIEHLGMEVFAGRYNVCFWLWELETFPAEKWAGAFDVLHEIWTPSSFCADAISAVSPVPVRRVPLTVEPASPPEPGFDRSHFGLPEGAFIFLYIFNFLSYFERKNPLAMIDAFRRAFPDPVDALLVLKTSQSDFAPEALERVRRRCEGANVELIDGYASREEIAALTALADCYVSLHRSEGFGLTLAESMAHGKPVIATPYSGNADFFDLNSGYPVRYRLVEIEQDEGPYPAGARWAEPDVDDAARCMREVYERRGQPDPVAERGRRRIEEDLSVEAIGRVVASRFSTLVRHVRRRAPRVPSPT